MEFRLQAESLECDALRLKAELHAFSTLRAIAKKSTPFNLYHISQSGHWPGRPDDRGSTRSGDEHEMEIPSSPLRRTKVFRATILC